MKKFAKLVGAAAAAFLLTVLAAGCNLDANQGIFREISTSAKTSGIRIVGAAGYDASSKTAYFVADNGLMAQKKGGAAETLVPSSVSRQIKQATFYTDGSGKHINFIAQDPAKPGETFYWKLDLSGGLPSDPAPIPIPVGDWIRLGAGMEIRLSGGAITVTDLGTGSLDATITTASSAPQVLSFADAASSTSEVLLTWPDAGGKGDLDFFVVSGAGLTRYSLDNSQVEDYANIAAFAYDAPKGRLLLAGRNGKLYYAQNLAADQKLKKASAGLEGAFPSTPATGFYSKDDNFIFKCDDSFKIVKWASGAEPSRRPDRTGGLANGNIVAAMGIGDGQTLVFDENSGLFVLDELADSEEKF